MSLGLISMEEISTLSVVVNLVRIQVNVVRLNNAGLR